MSTGPDYFAETHEPEEPDYFGNPKRLIFGDRQLINFDVTDSGPGWGKYQMDIRMIGRFGFTVANPDAFSIIDGCVPMSA